MSNLIQLKERDHSAREEVAASVRSFIARAGISKSRVAKEIGMAQSTFSRRTTGAEPFDADELGALANYFGVTLIELISGNPNIIAPNSKKADAPGRTNHDHLIHWSHIAPLKHLDDYRKAV